MRLMISDHLPILQILVNHNLSLAHTKALLD